VADFGVFERTSIAFFGRFFLIKKEHKKIMKALNPENE
jgi:hypothetical protein